MFGFRLKVQKIPMVFWRCIWKCGHLISPINNEWGFPQYISQWMEPLRASTILLDNDAIMFHLLGGITPQNHQPTRFFFTLLSASKLFPAMILSGGKNGLLHCSTSSPFRSCTSRGLRKWQRLVSYNWNFGLKFREKKTVESSVDHNFP